VTSRTNGREALSLLKAEPSRFDLAATDVTMPDTTGVDLARQMPAIRPGMPIVMSTGHSHLIDADAASAAGIKTFVMKPVTEGEIARTIRRVPDG
jgi:DNA-binding NtrC family response regulator